MLPSFISTASFVLSRHGCPVVLCSPQAKRCPNAPVKPLQRSMIHMTSSPGNRSEDEIVDQIIIPFLERIGYDSRDLTKEEQIEVGRERPIRADIVARVEGRVAFIVEAKKGSIDLEKQKNQALSYAKMLVAPYACLANDKEICVLDTFDGALLRRESLCSDNKELAFLRKKSMKALVASVCHMCKQMQNRSQHHMWVVTIRQYAKVVAAICLKVAAALAAVGMIALKLAPPSTVNSQPWMKKIPAFK